VDEFSGGGFGNTEVGHKLGPGFVVEL
jgi:hypothetical protein